MTFHGPMCRCGSRNTVRVGPSALVRKCLSCKRTFTYRAVNGSGGMHLVAFSHEVAAALDRERGGVYAIPR